MTAQDDPADRAPRQGPVRSPLVWYGGKGRLRTQIVPLFPPHATYVEVFGGAAWCLLAKPPSPVEVYNDIDRGLTGFFRVLRDPALAERFLRMAALTPYSREMYAACKDWESATDPVERAFRWFYVAAMSYSGRWGEGWSHSARGTSRGISALVSRYFAGVERLPDVAARLLLVQIENLPWEQLLATYDGPDTFFYCDPPYVPATRTKPSAYAHEMSLEAHTALVAALRTLQGRVMLSGYRNPLYATLETAGWQRLDFHMSVAAAARNEGADLVRQESIWINFPTHVMPGFWELPALAPRHIQGELR